jgi:hypothetical protein
VTNPEPTTQPATTPTPTTSGRIPAGPTGIMEARGNGL